MRILETFDIPPIKLKYQEPKVIRKSDLELWDNCVRYMMVFTADEWESADKSLPAEEVINSFHITADRERVAGFERSYLQDLDAWKITIHVSGFSQEITIYLKEKAAAVKLEDRLLEWKFGTKKTTPL